MLGALGWLASGGQRAAAKPSDPGPPAVLLVSIALGPTSTLTGLQAFLEEVKPGTGAQLTDAAVRQGLAKAAGVSSLDGLDPASRIYVLIAADSPEIALVAKVADSAKLLASAGAVGVMTRGPWAAIGPKPLLDRIGPYALTSIVAQPVPPAPTATVYLPHVLSRYAPQLRAMRGQMIASTAGTNPTMVRLVNDYVDGLAALGDDAAQLVVTLEVSPSTAWLDFALKPRAGSRLAAFAALQQPSSYALLARLPAAATAPAILLAGHLALGPYRDSLLAMTAMFYAPDASKEVLASLEIAHRAMTGEIALAADIARPGGLSFTQFYGVTDPGGASQALAAILEQFKTARTIAMSDSTMTIRANSDTTQYDGVALRSYDATLDYSTATPAKRQALETMNPSGTHRVQLAAFDKLFMLVTAKDGLAVAKRTIDAARGNAAHLAPGSATDALLATSRAHKDSLAMTIDVGAIGRLASNNQLGVAPVMMSLGFADRRAHIGLAIPAASARALMHVANP